MASPSQVESIFFAALEKKTENERTDYLDQACGADSALRARVERLLECHPQAMDFLAEPAVDREQLDSHDETEEQTGLAQTSGLRTNPAVPRTEPDTREAADRERGEDTVEDTLRFLEPSEKPGSLGRLAHYEVLEVLGTGGFGTVVKAFDEKLHRFVAIKLMSPLLAVSRAPRKRFVREARTAAAVRHENVIAIYAVEDEPIAYIVMDFIAGRNLQQKIDATGPLELRDVLKIGGQIAAGLAAAHAMGLVHRDIKPGNILLEGTAERVRITDFGLARAADDASITQSGFVAGTPMYMAPEQAQGEPVDQRADLFSLGSVLYTMCSGRPPFPAANTIAVLKRVVEDTPHPIREITPEVPPWLCEVISVLHAKNPADRISSAQELSDLLAHRLAELQGSGTIRPALDVPNWRETKPAPTQEIPIAGGAIRWPRSPNRRWQLAAVGLVMLLGSLGLAEATGVTDFHGTVIRLFSPEGTLVVEVDDAGVSVKIDGPDIVITGAGAREIRLTPGSYLVEATRNGKLVKQELVTVTKNGRRVVRVSREPAASVAMPAPRSADAPAWERAVTALSAGEQVKAVSVRLKELNPGFDGALRPTIENRAVRDLELDADAISDISPLRVLSRLRSLKLSGRGVHKSSLTDLSPLSGLPLTTPTVVRGQLADLTPLRGMPLTSLSIYDTLVFDLSPLEGMRLTYLHIGATKVSDISALEGMPLETLDIGGTKVKDVAALKGMRIESLGLENTKVADLSPLKGTPLATLNIVATQVSDLSPLAGMKLIYLNAGLTNVADLAPLNGMPLTHLNCHGTKLSDASLAQIRNCNDLAVLVLADTSVSDAGLAHLKNHKNLSRLLLQGTKVSSLSPLADMQPEEIRLTPRNIDKNGLDLIRHMKTLKTIGTDWNQAWPAAEFWARYDKGEFAK